MKMKGDCERDYIKEAFDKLYNRVMPYIDLNEFANADIAFKELDKKVHSEIHILKACLAESDRAVKAGLTRSKALQERINDLEKENSKLRTHNEGLSAACESHLKALSEATNELEQYKKSSFEVIDGKEREINDLKKKIHWLEGELVQARNSTELHLRKENDRLRKVIDGLEKENTDLHERLSSDKKLIETLEKSNSILRGDNETLWARLKERERDLDISKRPWHGDVNAMSGERTLVKSLAEAIEFQNKKIEELEAEKARLKENVDLSYGHEFEFGDEVFVPWSDAPYMYVKTGQLYNPRTKRLVYAGKTQHLKWFGDKFAIV